MEVATSASGTAPSMLKGRYKFYSNIGTHTEVFFQGGSFIFQQVNAKPCTASIATA